MNFFDLNFITRRRLLKGAVIGGTAFALPSFALGSSVHAQSGLSTANPSSTIISATVGTPYTYNTSSSHFMFGDTLANCWADDNNIYCNVDDTSGVNGQNLPGGVKFFIGTIPDAPTTHAITEINNMSYYGAQGSTSVDPDGVTRSWGASSMFCMNGVLYLSIGRIKYGTAGVTPQVDQYNSIIFSTDHGQNWYLFSDPNQTTPNVLPPRDSTAMFQTFCPYFIEHGQNGAKGPSAYKADQYIYAGDMGTFANSNQVHIGRVPRASILDKTAWQWYTGPVPQNGSEGLTDSNWSFINGSSSTPTPIFSAPNRTSFGEMRYVPGLGKYLMLSYYYAGDGPNEAYGQTASTVWTFFQSDAPWGPWSLFYTHSWEPQGFYIPTVPSKWMSSDGSNLWLICSGDYSTDSYHGYTWSTTEYTLHIMQLSLQTSGSSPNILSNPGFESGSLGPWSGSGASVIAGHANTGSYACQLTGGNVGIWQTLSGLNPNTTYTLTAWINPSSANDYAYVFVKNYAGTSPQITGPQVNVVTGGYSFTALHFTTDSAGTATIGVWKDGGTGSAWIDDLTLM